MKVLLIRIKDLTQYDSKKGIIVWEDDTQSRWDSYYSKLVKGDKVIAVIAGKPQLLAGTVDSLVINKAIKIVNVSELDIKNDDFLRINEIYPEKVSRMKANFQPFIPVHEINWDNLINEIEKKQLIKFYIVKSEKFKNLSSSGKFNLNDRIVLINDGKFENFGAYKNGNIVELNEPIDLYNIKGKTINEVLSIQKNNLNPIRTRGSNKVKLVENIITELNSQSFFEFNSFYTYYDILHNKSLYLNNKDVDGEDEFLDYYLLGTSYGGTNDQSDRFFNDGIWENGNTDEKNKNLVNSISENSRIAAKSTVRLRDGSSFLRIKRYGIVTKNLNDGQKLIVQWDDEIEQFDIPGPYVSRYSATVNRVKDEDVSVIFYPERNNITSKLINNNMEQIKALNTILYGPPGTGKTYNTIDEALKIVAKTEYDETIKKFSTDEKIQREKVIELFNAKLVKSDPGVKIDWKNTEGKIAFCTFHQSFSYEDFIEGIKPNTDGKEISYTIEDGIFKLMCELSNRGLNNSSHIIIPDNSRFTKLLVPTQDDLNYCVTNKLVGVKRGISSGQENYFKNSLSSADNTHIVLLTFDNKLIKAIGLITGECKPDPTSRFNLVREVKWLYPDCSIEIASFYTAKINENVLDDLDEKDVKKVIEENLKGKTDNSNYVLIIDEINRGNVSQIFGELITLIETDKRLGEDNVLSVILPYSKSSFTVPNNLYIIGTMNTADRSVEALDTALRRRFDFIEMPPVYSKLDGKKIKLNGKDFTELNDVLKTINERLKVLLTKDHQIGHSYFLKINSKVTIQNVFKNNIIPLLQEYFYGDFAKICMVLGESFIKKRTAKDDSVKKPFFAYGGHEATLDYEEKEIWTINEEIFDATKEKEFVEAIEKLLNPKVN